MRERQGATMLYKEISATTFVTCEDALDALTVSISSRVWVRVYYAGFRHLRGGRRCPHDRVPILLLFYCVQA